MSCAMHGTETIMIKNQFYFLMTMINVCFNVSFIFISQFQPIFQKTYFRQF